MSWQEFVAAVQDDNPQVLRTALWGKDRLKYDYDQDVEGIERVFVGHTILEKAKYLGNTFFIDTGSHNVGDGITTIADITTPAAIFEQPNAVIEASGGKINAFGISLAPFEPQLVSAPTRPVGTSKANLNKAEI